MVAYRFQDGVSHFIVMRGGAFLMGHIREVTSLVICMIKHLDVLNFICQVDSHAFTK